MGSLRGYAAVMLAACSWGTWRFILLAAERRAPSLDARVESAIVMIVITLFAFAILPFEKREGPRPSLTVTVRGSAPDTPNGLVPLRSAPRLSDWLLVAWLGLADAMNVYLLFTAYAKTSVAIAVTTHYLAPILVATLAPIALRERAQQGTWLAATGGLFGLALLLRPWGGDLAARDLIGAAAGAGSAVFYASNVLVNKRLVTKFTPIELMAYHGVVATPLLVALAPLSTWGNLTAPATLVLVGGGIGPGALGGVLFIWALRRARAADASTLTLLEPLVAVGIAVFAYGERLTAVSWLGASTILACAAMIMRRAA